MVKFKLKYRFKITLIRDKKARVFRYADESSVLVFMRINKLQKAGTPTKPFIKTRKEAVVTSYFGKNGEVAIVEDRIGGIN